MLAEDRLNTIVSMVQQAGSVTGPELADAPACRPLPFDATYRRSTERTASPRCTVARQVLSART